MRRSVPTANGFVSRPSFTAVSGKTSWHTTTSGAPNRFATARPIDPTIGGSVMQRTTSGRSARRPEVSELPR